MSIFIILEYLKILKIIFQIHGISRTWYIIKETMGISKLSESLRIIIKII